GRAEVGEASMTEAEWLACTDPEEMLPLLRGKASDRKLRLFACSWARRVWHFITHPDSRTAVEVAERFAEGEASTEALGRARYDAQEVMFAPGPGGNLAWKPAWGISEENAWYAAEHVSRWGEWDWLDFLEGNSLTADRLLAEQASALRCVFG